MHRRTLFVLGLGALSSALPACAGTARRSSGGSGDATVEVFSWWAGPGEKDGAPGPGRRFPSEQSRHRVRQRGRRGGRRRRPHGVLATRLQNDDPPSSYQGHAGLELRDDILAGYVRTSPTCTTSRAGGTRCRRAWSTRSPSTAGSTRYRLHIHRANLLWYLPRTLRSLGLAVPPKTWSEFLAQAAGSGPPAGRRCRSGPSGRRSTCWRPCCSASWAPTGTPGCGPGAPAGPAPPVLAATRRLQPGARSVRHGYAGRRLAAGAGGGG